MSSAAPPTILKVRHAMENSDGGGNREWLETLIDEGFEDFLISPEVANATSMKNKDLLFFELLKQPSVLAAAAAAAMTGTATTATTSTSEEGSLE